MGESNDGSRVEMEGTSKGNLQAKTWGIKGATLLRAEEVSLKA